MHKDEQSDEVYFHACLCSFQNYRNGGYCNRGCDNDSPLHVFQGESFIFYLIISIFPDYIGSFVFYYMQVYPAFIPFHFSYQQLFLELVYCYYIYFVLSFSVPIPLNSSSFFFNRVFHFYCHYPHLFSVMPMNKGFEG